MSRADPATEEVAQEQAHIDRAYARLDALRGRAFDLIEESLREGVVHGDQGLFQRDALIFNRERRLSQLSVGDEALVFGRIDRTDGETYHIGRVAVPDESHTPLVVDWRAPVSEPFYRATGAHPMGLRRRRHLICRGSKLVGVEDELLDSQLDGDGMVLIGEGALMAALERSRTGRMGDIVATIQAEQDAIIRSPLEGTLVVQGGPGTGKTAVALHRAAYLLYTHRERLERAGVLVVGPNRVFLRYIERVLPSLGEEAVRLATPASLFSGVRPEEEESPESAAVKGDARMAAVLKRALSLLRNPPAQSVTIRYGAHELSLSTADARRILDKVAARKGDHNSRRRAAFRLVASHLYRRYLKSSGRPSSEEGEKEFRGELASHSAIVALLDVMWPEVRAGELVGRLLSSARFLSQAASGILKSHEQSLIVRDQGDSWTEADVALLDEAHDLTGPAGPPHRDEEGREDAMEFFIRQTLEGLGGVDDHMRAALTEHLYRAYTDTDASRAPERTSFGYAVVDEAQDLSPMQWRMIARRCPSGAMTVVGDLGQANRPWSLQSWEELALHLLPRARVRIEELHINYRTPEEIMEFAIPLSDRAGVAAPQSVRKAGAAPVVVEESPGGVAGRAVREARSVMEALGEGRAAIIVPARLVDEVRREAGVQVAVEEMLDLPVAVLKVDEAKGLEFDAVVVAEPAAIAEESSGGTRALYVAFTRATQRLVVVQSRSLRTSPSSSTSV